MHLLVKLQIMQHLTTLVTFSKSEEFSHRSIGIELVQFSIIAIYCLLLLLLIARQLLNMIIRYQKHSSQFSFSQILLTQLFLRGKCIHSNVSINLPGELIIIGWAFMHEVNISSTFSLARFFITQRLIYKSKIEKNYASLGIFISDTNIGRNFNLHGLKKRQIWTHTSLQDQISVFVLVKIKVRLRIRALSCR